ncbi:hypothetical protein [Streptomyces sp. NPDC057682]|uniref:hypothetical protein n=1 Tax=Streptomyces sp. NPDC057682 TaxID=3346210 RepID=UPI003689AE50
MTNFSQALALHDMASLIDRLRFQLRALPAPPSLPGVETLSARSNILAAITKAVCEKVDQCLIDLPSQGSTEAVQAYSKTLAPLGEVATELGRIQAEVATYKFSIYPEHKNDRVELARRAGLANKVVSESRDTADRILEMVVSGLREEAATLAPPTAGRLQGAIPSPYASGVEQNRSTPAAPPPPAPLKNASKMR